MKKRLSSIGGLLIACLALVVAVPITGTITGCQSSQVAAGSDAFVVEAEKDIRTAFHLVDGFLLWESQNRATAGPEVTQAADMLRVNFPAWHRSAQKVLRTYKAARTPEAKADLSTWLATINSAMLQAVKYLPTAEANNALRTANSN